MSRSSRHKSRKHTSRDARDYSDSEKELGLKERRGKEDSSGRVSKESGSGEKRTLDSKVNKDYYDSVNGESYEEFTSSRRREDKFDDSVNDRWNGGENDRGESSKRSKAEKSRRRGEGEGEGTKKSSSKDEGKHRESNRMENIEYDRDRDVRRKHKEGKTERFVDGEDHHGSKMVSDKTDLNAEDRLRSPESENRLERRARHKKESQGDVDKHQDNIQDFNDRLLSSRDDSFEDGRKKEEKYRDKYREDIDRDNNHQGDMERDDLYAREHANARSDEKHSQDKKDASESRRKMSKLLDNDHNCGQEHGHGLDSEHNGYRDHSRDYEHNHDYEREHKHGRDRDREKERDKKRKRRDYVRDRYHERHLDHDRRRDRGWDLDRDKNRDRVKDRKHDCYYDHDRRKIGRNGDYDRDGSYLDDQGVLYKDGRERKKSPDDYDDLSDSKSRATAALYPDMETERNRAEPEGVGVRSQARRGSSMRGGQDEFMHMSEQRLKAMSLREATDFSWGSDEGSMHRSSEKSTKMGDNHVSELSVERSLSPMRLVERSPSSTSIEYKHINRSTKRSSLEIEETGLNSNAGDLPSEKHLPDESSQTELSFYDKASQNNSSFPFRPDSRGRVGSPLVGSLEENRVNISSNYRRGSAPNVGRGQGNAWRSTPNRPSPVPNGFMPFQHGPPHGGFQSMMPLFSSPSLLGLRTLMKMSHSGIPYHMPDAERFSDLILLPIGWQSVIDGSRPSHMHGWDVTNGVFRDESHVYGGPEWNPSRNQMHGRGKEISGADTWKTRSGDVSMDVSSTSKKENDDFLARQTSYAESNRAKIVEAGSNITSLANFSESSPKFLAEKASDHPTTPIIDDVDSYRRYYLSKLDISVELAGPELHNKCISLLINELSAMVNGETAVLVNLKDGGKTVSKGFSSLFIPPLFPASNSSVFKRASELYKKQSVEMNGLSTTEPIVLEDAESDRIPSSGNGSEVVAPSKTDGDNTGLINNGPEDHKASGDYATNGPLLNLDASSSKE